MPSPQVARQAPEYHNVLVIGCGVTGLALACQLKTMLGETDIRLFERESGLGGTWWSNSYPGAACDIPIPLYSFSFAQKNDWSTFFAAYDEIQTYLQEVADRFDVTNKCLFSTEVVTAEWDEGLGLWHVYTRPATGSSERGGETKHWMCRVLCSAVGGLSQPNKCTVDGHETFEGPLFHSARWDHSVSMKDKNVIVVGNGCSATQFLPIIAKEAKTVTQFVRSKHWYAKRPANPVNSGVWRWMVRHIPGFVYFQRAMIFFVLEASMLMMFKNRLGTWYRNRFANKCIDYIKKTAPEKYHEQLLPYDMLPGCKRRVFDTGYLPALHRSNVELETEHLVQIKPKSVMTKDGRELPADVICLANGFNVTEMGFPMKIYGRGGKDIQEHWAEAGGPQAYRGTMVSSHPNFFLCQGPNTGTGHFSYIFTAECTTRFAIKVMAPLLKTPRPSVLSAKLPGAVPGPSVSVLPRAERDENVWIQRKSQDMVYSQNCGSWYVDPDSGRVTAVYPSFQFMFWLRAVNPLYHWDLRYEGCSTPGGLLTRLREYIGIGGTPRPSRQDLEKFEKGHFKVGQPGVREKDAKDEKEVRRKEA